MKYTIKQWFERVADPKIREELLANMYQDKSNNYEDYLCDAILKGTKIFENEFKYREMAKQNQIKLLPKIKKSDLLERIEKLEKQQASDHVMIMDILAKLEGTINKEFRESIRKKLTGTDNAGAIIEKEKKIVFDWHLSDEKLWKPTRLSIGFHEIKEVSQSDRNVFIFEAYDKGHEFPLIYIGHYE